LKKKQNVSKYQLSKTQVESILELKLQKLTAFGISEIEEEIKKIIQN
jgi:Type IIA topoisomerase (DNA gyrase/topo II, topoisomerase IV), A subunit